MAGGHKRRREPDANHADAPADAFARADKETLAYFAELQEHLKTLNSTEEKQLLADNALGDQTDVVAATDAACSRVLEALFLCASTEVLCTYLGMCTAGENLGAICTSGPFGSHVLEKLLAEVADRGARAPDGAEAARVAAALAALTAAVGASLYDVVTHRYSSFVARRLLCVLAGRDVSPPPGKKHDAEGGAPAAALRGAAAGGALAARMGGGGGGAPAAAYPALLESLAGVVLSDDWAAELPALRCDPAAGPFLQALLRATAPRAPLVQRLVLRLLGTASPEGVTPDALHALLTDRGGSHLAEAVFACAPDELFQKLATAAFKGRLPQLAQHPTANFGVQAALAALRRPAQLKRMLEDLRPSLPTLLRSRRAGVVAALIAAAGRLHAHEADAAAALWHACGELPGGAAAAGGGPLAALLALDTAARLGQRGGGGAPRFSPLGCATAAAVLAFPPEACRQWADALGGLGGAELASLARDPGGARVVEAYLRGPGAAPKKRRRLLRALAGGWGEAACASAAGARFVENCFAAADAGEKEAIAGALAAARDRLAGAHWGAALLRRCQVDAFRAGGGGALREKLRAADATRREFDALFASDEGEGEGDGDGDGDGDGAGAGDGEGDGEPPAAAAAAGGEAGEAAATAATGGAEQPPMAKKKKKKKKKERSVKP